MTYKWTFTVYA